MGDAPTYEPRVQDHRKASPCLAASWSSPRVIYGFDLDLWLAGRTPGFTVASPRPDALRIEHHGKATDFTVDPGVGLPLKWADISLADADGAVPGEMRFEGWRELSGVRFPPQSELSNGMKRGEVTMSDIRLNVGLRKLDLEAKPADFAPEIPSR